MDRIDTFKSCLLVFDIHSVCIQVVPSLQLPARWLIVNNESSVVKMYHSRNRNTSLPPLVQENLTSLQVKCLPILSAE